MCNEDDLGFITNDVSVNCVMIVHANLSSRNKYSFIKKSLNDWALCVWAHGTENVFFTFGIHIGGGTGHVGTNNTSANKYTGYNFR